MVRMCEENVESDCSIDCSSPMSRVDRPVRHEAAALVAGHGQPRLGHQGQQTDGLERDRLPAGVRSRDEQSRGLVAQVKVDSGPRRPRGGGWRARTSVVVPRSASHEASPSARGRAAPSRFPSSTFARSRSRCAMAASVASASSARSPTIAESCRRDAALLALLGQLQLPHLVARLHHRHGLQEHRCAARRHVMHDSLELPPEVRLHGDHHPSVALGEQFLLGDAAAHRVRERDSRPLFETCVCAAQLTTDRGQLRAGPRPPPLLVA